MSPLDKMVLRSYEKSVKKFADRFEIGLLFKKENVDPPNNHQYTMNLMVKLDNRF